MFYDCTHRKIGDTHEFAVAIGGLLYHGSQLDPEEVELTPQKGEQLLVIECYCEFAREDNLLKVLTFTSKENEEKVLPNVYIISPK